MNLVIGLAFLVIALGLFYIFLIIKGIEKNYPNQNHQLVDLWTIEFDKEGNPKQDKAGKYVMQLLKKDYLLTIPVLINSDDTYIKPPFFEHNNKLWAYHSIVQLENRTNLIVMFAGSVAPEKSPFCADAKKHKTKTPVMDNIK